MHNNSDKENDCNRSDWKVNGNIATHKSGFTVTAETSPTDPSKTSCTVDLSPMRTLNEELDFEALILEAWLLVIEGDLTEAPEK
jgi:hypothetical protein